MILYFFYWKKYFFHKIYSDCGFPSPPRSSPPPLLSKPPHPFQQAPEKKSNKIKLNQNRTKQTEEKEPKGTLFTQMSRNCLESTFNLDALVTYEHTYMSHIYSRSGQNNSTLWAQFIPCYDELHHVLTFQWNFCWRQQHVRFQPQLISNGFSQKEGMCRAHTREQCRGAAEWWGRKLGDLELRSGLIFPEGYWSGKPTSVSIRYLTNNGKYYDTCHLPLLLS